MTARPISEATSCLPCCYGEHSSCRHRPEGRRFSGPRSEQGKPCACEQSGHVLGDGTCSAYRWIGTWDKVRCDKPVKATIIDREFSVDYERHVCGIHAAAYRKRKANDEKRRAKWAADDAARARAAENLRSATDWSERLRAEFGIESTPQRDDHLRVAVNPERLYGVLADYRAALAECGIELEQTR